MVSSGAFNTEYALRAGTSAPCNQPFYRIVSFIDLIKLFEVQTAHYADVLISVSGNPMLDYSLGGRSRRLICGHTQI